MLRILFFCDRKLIFENLSEEPIELFQNEDVLTNLKIEPPKVFSVARSLIKNGLNIDLGKIKDVSSLAKEIARVEEKNE
mgnify:CR=1 FL=1